MSANTNASLLKELLEKVDVSPTTQKDYRVKLEAMSKHVDFAGTQDSILDFLKKIPNPNTKSNKTSIILKLRDVLGHPTDKLVEYRNQTKEEVVRHRRAKATENANSLMDYKELMEHIDGMSGRDYFLNFMFATYGVRNQDVNVRYVRNITDKNSTENLVSFNPSAKKPKVTLHISDYKTSRTYGPKTIIIKDQRLFDELKSLNLKNNQYVFGTKEGKKPTMLHMNVLAKRRSVKQYGEGRIAKILVKHLLDNKLFNKLGDVSEYRGTALSTLYTSYNVLDNDDTSQSLPPPIAESKESSDSSM